MAPRSTPPPILVNLFLIWRLFSKITLHSAQTYQTKRHMKAMPLHKLLLIQTAKFRTEHWRNLFRSTKIQLFNHFQSESQLWQCKSPILQFIFTHEFIKISCRDSPISSITDSSGAMKPFSLAKHESWKYWFDTAIIGPLLCYEVRKYFQRKQWLNLNFWLFERNDSFWAQIPDSMDLPLSNFTSLKESPSSESFIMARSQNSRQFAIRITEFKF